MGSFWGPGLGLLSARPTRCGMWTRRSSTGTGTPRGAYRPTIRKRDTWIYGPASWEECPSRRMHLRGQNETRASGAEKTAIAELMLKYTDVEARMDEIRLWEKAEEENPRYGTQVRVNGMWRPKLPEFGSLERALEAMNSPTGGGHSAAAVKAAREFRSSEDARETVRSLDGRSPLVPEEERKPFNTTL